MKWLALLLTISACNTGLHPADYSKQCSVDADCVAVFMGDPCNGCGCTNDAISTSSKSKYDADARAYASFCSPPAAVPGRLHRHAAGLSGRSMCALHLPVRTG